MNLVEQFKISLKSYGRVHQTGSVLIEDFFVSLFIVKSV